MSMHEQTMLAAGSVPQQRAPLNRRNSTSSTMSIASSRKGSEYWNELLCMFSGVGKSDLKDASGGVPKEYFDADYQGRNRSSSMISRQSSDARRSSSMFSRRPTSSSQESLSDVPHGESPRSRKLQRRTNAALSAVPEADIGHFQSPQLSPLEQRMATVPYFQALSPSSLPYSMPNGSNWPLQGQVPPSQQGNAQEPRMIGIWKDGEMHWIREDILSALTLGAPQQFAQPQSTMQGPLSSAVPTISPKPNMTISIPPGQYNSNIMPYRPSSPAESMTSVYTQLPIQGNPNTFEREPSMSYPHETSAMIDQASMGESPISAKSGSYTGSSEGYADGSSPTSHHSSNTSMSSFDYSPKPNVVRNYSVKNPATAGVFDNNSELAYKALPRTPTLDQAEHDLRQELTSFESSQPQRPITTPTAPPLPTRSRMRESYIETTPARRTSVRRSVAMKPESVYKAQRESVVSDVQPSKKRGLRITKAFTFRRKRATPSAESKPDLSKISSPVIVEEAEPMHELRGRASTTIERHLESSKISADAAEQVIHHIFENVSSFDDLFAFARINKGFFSVFKRSELALIRNVHRNICPAAWELRESSPREIIAGKDEKSDYTPTRYMQFQQRDSLIIASVRAVIRARCQPFLRLETVEALYDKESTRSQQLDNALLRICTFCCLFGANKGREHDLPAQMDWLRGGKTFRSSESATFGLGNSGGLSAEELYDMTELWNCLKALVSGVQGPGQTSQARLIGVFKGKHVKKGDADSQDALLEEWLSYLVTLGLSTVLDIANATNDGKPNAFFYTASEMGWNKWTAPNAGTSRASFLTEALSQVYEEKVAIFHPAPSREAQEVAKSRTARFAAELKEMKRASAAAESERKPRLSNWLRWIDGVESSAASEEDNHRGRAPSRQGEQPSSPRTSSQPTAQFSPRAAKNGMTKRAHSSHPSASTTISATTASSAGAHSSNVSDTAEPKSPATSCYSSVYSSRANSPSPLPEKSARRPVTMVEA